MKQGVRNETKLAKTKSATLGMIVFFFSLNETWPGRICRVGMCQVGHGRPEPGKRMPGRATSDGSFGHFSARHGSGSSRICLADLGRY